jgi:endonuclease III
VSKSSLAQIVSTLRTRYGRLPEPPADAFTLFVWEILSNHSTPKRRKAAMAALKKAGALTPDGMWECAPRKIEEAVALAGPYSAQRVQGLKKGIEVFRRHQDLPSIIKGPLPAALRALKGIPLMGEGGAYRMLLFPGGQPVIPVDARVARVATRLGYGERNDNFSKTARSIRQAVTSELAGTVTNHRDAYLYFEHHGATTCTESRPKCDVCPLLKDCAYGRSHGQE